MKRNNFNEYLNSMPKGAYIILKSVMIASCLMLAASLVMFAVLERAEEYSYSLYLAASYFLENPFGILLVGLLAAVIVAERCQ